eukprot:GHRR01023705.1.p2 GENE.GHRR01023705.1~~GHRR01023705.1.p2  ORF type:complete len:110 (-),score=19.09 GHRR01023705.1:959-1288(-)
MPDMLSCFSCPVHPSGDSRAVLSSCGRALDLTRDHKPHQPAEKERIELCGGYVCDRGYLCGQLAVARAIGDYHLPGLKKQASTGGLIGPSHNVIRFWQAYSLCWAYLPA